MILTLLFYVVLGAALAAPTWLLWTRWLWPRLQRSETRLKYLVAYVPLSQRDSATAAPPAKR